LKIIVSKSITLFAVFGLLVQPFSASAEVTSVTVTSRSIVAGGQSFGSTGPYEKLIGRIEFALDPADPHNSGIVDLQYATRGTDGRVRFSSDLYVLRPAEPTKGNGVLLFEVANRGHKGLLPRFNHGATSSDDPTTAAHFGDGLLMRDGYTVVWIGWELNLPAPLLRIDAPAALLPPGSDDRVSVEVMVNERSPEAFLIDEPGGARPPVIYPPVNSLNQTDTLTVRDRFWDNGVAISRRRWQVVAGPDGIPKLRLDGGFEPGRYYQVTYRAAAPRVAGVGLAAIRDAASAFRYRSDLPIHGETSYAAGISQTGRFLRQFLYDGFNADERDRRVFDAIWPHIAGAARGSFNERLATPSSGSPFTPTKFPFADDAQRDLDGTIDGLQSRYRADQRPKIFYTNTPVEYWGGGRAAAFTHTTIDGTRDLTLPENVRIYMLAGAMHFVGPFPPTPPQLQRPGEQSAPAPGGNPAARNNGQQAINPTPQNNVMRALLRAWHDWAANGTLPPASQYPRLSDKTLVSIRDNRFPALPGVSDPRSISGPARVVLGKVTPLPHLVPQVDRDGNDLAGIHDPEVAVPLATTTGWNFRAQSVGNPGDIYQLIGSYIPFAKTRAEREAGGDLRLSVEERYRDRDDYLQRVRSAAMDLIRDRYLLEEDLDRILTRANAHWTFAIRDQSSTSYGRR
jgi:Alpha/beta hydrolase domain